MAERPEDLNLPQSVIGRIMKDAVPEGVSVSKEARNAVSKAASVFVLYATSCANNQALQAKRKTLNANDVFQALRDMEFEEFIEPLQKSLEEFRKEQKMKKEAMEKRKKTKENGESSGDKDTAAEDEEGKSKDEEEDDEGIEDEEEEPEEEDDDGDDGWVEEEEDADKEDDAVKTEEDIKPNDSSVEIMEEDS